MATYGLKYFWTVDRGGHAVRLDIYQRDYGTSATKWYIGGLQSLALEIQGGDNAPEAAVITTALHFVIEDSFDVPNGNIAIREGGTIRNYAVKHRFWEEFYTPDATLYKVRLSVDGSAMWTGYLTPDSWEEDLSYHSLLSLTARDNVGHLRDFDFDLDGTNGMVTLREIVEGAFDKCELAMTGTLSDGDLLLVTPSGTEKPAGDACFNVVELAKRSWYDALESVLDSMGFVLRYVGGNAVSVMTLRAWSEMSRTGKGMQAVDNSGHRSLSAAYRRIAETFRPEGDGIVFEIFQTRRDYTSMWVSGVGDTYVPSSSSIWTRSGSIGMINPYALTGPSPRGGVIPDGRGNMFLSVFDTFTPAEGTHSLTASVKMTGQALGGTLYLAFSAFAYQVMGSYEYLLQRAPSGSTTASMTLHYALRGTKDGRTVYFNGTTGVWGSSFSPLSANVVTGQPASSIQRTGATRLEASVEMNLQGVSEVAVMLFGFSLTTSDTTLINLRNQGVLYGMLTRCEITQQDAELPERKVTTIYDERQNTQLNRNPEFGELTFDVLSGRAVTNGIYCLDNGVYAPMQGVKWAGERMAAKSLSVLIHQQILTFHSKAVSVLSGTIRDASDDCPSFADRYTFNGAAFYPVGGTLNLLSGFIDNATLRELIRYDSLWVDGYAYEVWLDAVGSSLLATTKALKEQLGIGLKEAKALAESAPVLVTTYTRQEMANALRDALGEAGASARVEEVMPQ